MIFDPIEKFLFDANKICHENPPQWRHNNKIIAYEISCSTGYPFDGDIFYARWPEAELPYSISIFSEFDAFLGLLDYSINQDDAFSWHMNFSDELLFIAYGSSLLAQDEMQVAEHPALGAVREALIARGVKPVTESDDGMSTPVTISGVQRRCAINTLPNAKAGYPDGLYGNAFAQATEAQVRAAVSPISPPTLSNILAMAAPSGGAGFYSREQIERILTTAYTGFISARKAGMSLSKKDLRTVINTGFWGCGAFGGNRQLMVIIQSIAADLAEVDIKFWTPDANGLEVVRAARSSYESLRSNCTDVSEILDFLFEQRYRWGVSDGN